MASYNFFDTWTSEFLTSVLLNIELLDSLVSNINDTGNNEKTKNLKTRLGMFENMGRNIPGSNFLVGNFPGGSFPDTVAINLSCVKPCQLRRNSSCLCNVQKQSSRVVL